MDHAYNYMDSATCILQQLHHLRYWRIQRVGDIRMEYPYTQVINMDNTTVISVGEDNGDRSHAPGWYSELATTLDGM